jgi:MoaA/NifB/PqqE/SkfB family radical SAM enzyme
MTRGFPQSVCFRVTRACNARCGFCLAPWDGEHPPAELLLHRIDWLIDRGVRTVHFCGGEPTIHPALGSLIARVRERGATPRLTTNGIAMPAPLVEALRRHRVHTKVSLHGGRAWHDRIVGRPAYDAATGSLRRLLSAGAAASVQTTLVAGGGDVLGEMIAFCLAAGVRRLSLLPFIPRGDGAAREAEFALSSGERRALRRAVAAQRRRLGGRLDLRWLDFTTDRAPVVEADGRVLLEGPREASDTLLAIIPGPGHALDPVPPGEAADRRTALRVLPGHGPHPPGIPGGSTSSGGACR